MHSKNPVSLWSGRVGLQIQFKRRPRVEYKGLAQRGPFAFIICISPGHFTNICKCLSFLADFIVLCGGWIMIQIEWLAIERLTKSNGSPFNLKGLYLWSGPILWSQFCSEYLLVTIKIRSYILFKTTALKSEVKASIFSLSKSKSSARMRHN